MYCRKCSPIYRDPAQYDCHRKHGKTRNPDGTRTKVYAAFYSARRRCSGTGRWARWYRGVEFRFESFEQWYAELGEPPSPKHTVDRISVLGHYEPGNVRWVTWDVQSQNKRPRESAQKCPDA
jgi:hypothetical protein